MSYFLLILLFLCFSSALAFDFNYPNKDDIYVMCDSTNSVQNYFRLGKKYYFLGTSQRVSWIEAAHTCRQFGGDLALIESADEMNHISAYLLRLSYAKNEFFWLSGNDLITTNKYMSIANGLPLPYTAWSLSQPDNPGIEQCVHLWYFGTSFKMNNAKCDMKAYFLCERQNYTRCRDIY